MTRRERFAVLLMVSLLGSGSHARAEPAAALITDPVYAHAQQRVEVEPGRSLNLHCTGSGRPTVIFESGLTDPTNVWGLVQPRVAATTRACSYDRAGIGFSDPAQRPSTSAHIVDDLHRLLRAAAIEPPYVLVAHSSGAIHVRLYAATYPSEVAGMVLVDPSSEDQSESYRKLDPRRLTREQWQTQVVGASWGLRRQCIAAAEAATLTAGTELYKKCDFPQMAQLSADLQAATIAFQMTAAFQRAQLSEEETFGASQDALKRAHRDLGAVPLIVLTKGPRPPPATPLPPEEQALRDAREQLWFSLNRAIAERSTRGKQRIVPGAGHLIHLEKPDVVGDAVMDVWRTAKTVTAR